MLLEHMFAYACTCPQKPERYMYPKNTCIVESVCMPYTSPGLQCQTLPGRGPSGKGMGQSCKLSGTFQHTEVWWPSHLQSTLLIYAALCAEVQAAVGDSTANDKSNENYAHNGYTS